jgi:hypothetical protein
MKSSHVGSENDFSVDTDSHAPMTISFFPIHEAEGILEGLVHRRPITEKTIPTVNDNVPATV